MKTPSILMKPIRSQATPDRVKREREEEEEESKILRGTPDSLSRGTGTGL